MDSATPIKSSVCTWAGKWPALQQQWLTSGLEQRNTPTFGVVVPVHNAALTLRDTTTSILPQLGEGDRLYLVENGSCDESWSLVKELATDPHIVAIRLSKADASEARNAGIAASNEDYIAFCDADDIWSSDKLKWLRLAINQHQTLDIVCHSYCTWRDNQFALLGRDIVQKRLWRYPTLLQALLIRLCFFFTSAIIIRRSLLPTHTFSSGLSHTQDYEAWCHLAVHNRNPYIVFIDMPLAYYRFESGLSRARQTRLSNTYHIVRVYASLLPWPARLHALFYGTLRTLLWGWRWRLLRHAVAICLISSAHVSIRKP